MRHDSPNQIQRATQRRGILMTEALVAAVLTSVLLALLVPSLTAIRRQRERQRFETLALVEINNQADSLTGTSSSPAQLSTWFQARYPDARISLEPLDQATNSLGIPGIRITIARSGEMNGTDQKVSLVVWHPSTGAQP
ncbi:MAG: hypothetical protein JNM43_22610 [Planctomycetaceae bacterium]|nr:hypothetical protein [Planctomycetaceae bacterium]